MAGLGVAVPGATDDGSDMRVQQRAGGTCVGRTRLRQRVVANGARKVRGTVLPLRDAPGRFADQP
jgi:hypothetical protein